MDRLWFALSVWISLCVLCDLPAQELADDAAALVRDSGIRGGLVVHVGCEDGSWTSGLRVDERYLVQGLALDAQSVSAAQTRFFQQGKLGPISIQQWGGSRLPYADNLVNLLIVENGIAADKEDVLRVLAPGGVACFKTRDGLQRLAKPWPTRIDEWTHFLHGPDNNAVAQDTRIAPPHHLQWTAGPRWGRSHDQLASVSAVVSAAGRIFSVVDEGSIASVMEPSQWYLVARDAFNGVLLWKQPLSPWEDALRPFRSGPAELPRRLVADGNYVYVTLGYGQPVTALDAATGKILHSYPDTADAQEILLDAGRLYVVAGKLRVRQRRTPVPDLPEWLVPYPQYVYTQPAKRVVCVSAEDAEIVWKRQDEETANLLPLTLALSGGRLFFHNEKHLIGLDADSGNTLWTADRPISLQRYAWSVPTVVVQDGIVLSGDRTAEEKMDLGAGEGRTPRWLVSSGHDLFGGEIVAFSAETGEKLWSVPCHENFNAPVDVFVVRGQVWSGQVAWTPQPGIAQVYDLKTGEVVAQRPPDSEFGRFGHHRCYRAKATVNYILHSRRGIEFVDMNSDQLLVDRWTRGTCQYGILPCNGMIYTPPHACACFVTHQLNGFNALSAVREPVAAQDAPRLQKGPAYGQNPATALEPGEWPMYRKDAARSGFTQTKISPQLVHDWSQSVGGPLTAPVVAEGMVLFAKPQQHTICARNADDGAPLWHFSAGAPVDSPPAVFQGFVYFGSADGWVYCLRSSDGHLAWRRRVAPEARQIVSYERLESTWPVQGSVLVHQPTDAPPTVHGVAGRSTYLDEGMVLFALHAITGEILSEQRLYYPSPDSIARAEKPSKDTFRVNVLPDLLSSDGSRLFMRNQVFDLQGKPITKKVQHLFSSTGFLDDTWWHRSYWQYGADMSSGYGGWINAGNRRISGRLLVQRDDRIFGFGRKDYLKSGSHIGRGIKHHLFSAQTSPLQEPKERRRNAEPVESTEVRYDWSVDVPFFVRALVLADDHLLIAGPSDISDLDATLPEGDVWLRVVSAADGATLAEYPLPAVPVCDSLAIGQQSLIMTTVDGQVMCYRWKTL